MEIRTIGNISAGSRLAVDSGMVPQAAQVKASEQAAVQTENAVTRVAEPEEAGMARKPADPADAHRQARESGQQANPDVSVRLALNGMKAEKDKTRSAESRDAARQPDGDVRAAQAQSKREERLSPVDEAAKQAEKERTQKVVDNISESLLSMQKSLDLTVDEDLGRVVVRIVDPETREVIKQIPSEEALELAKSLSKMTGMFVETRA